MDVPKPPTVSLEEECPCMTSVRKRNQKYFNDANKELHFHQPVYEINEDYFSGYSAYPISYVFTYRNVYGGLSHGFCKCKEDWRTDIPNELHKQLRQVAYFYKKCMEADMCQCGLNLIRYLDKIDKDGITSHYCQTVSVNPIRHIYRHKGRNETMLCTCSNQRILEQIEDSSESESESEPEEDYE